MIEAVNNRSGPTLPQGASAIIRSLLQDRDQPSDHALYSTVHLGRSKGLWTSTAPTLPRDAI